MSEENQSLGSGNEYIDALEARIAELERWRGSIVDVVFAQLDGLQEDIERIKGGGAVAEPAATFEPNESGHVIIEDSKARAAAKKTALGVVGTYPAGKSPVTTCDEPHCAAAGHVEMMGKNEARAFNAERVNRELTSMPRESVKFALDCLSADVGDGHRVSTEGSNYQLPSGRNIAVTRATAWAFGNMPQPPSQVKRTCDRGDCVAPAHLYS